MSLLDKITESLSQIPDLFSKQDISSNQNPELNKTEVSSFWAGLFGGNEVYQNRGFAYRQIGKQELAQADFKKVKEI